MIKIYYFDLLTIVLKKYGYIIRDDKSYEKYPNYYEYIYLIINNE